MLVGWHFIIGQLFQPGHGLFQLLFIRFIFIVGVWQPDFIGNGRF